MWIIHSGPVFWVHNSLLFLKESCYFLWSTCFTAEAECGIKRDNFCQICVLENPGPTMRHTVGYWIGPASAERLIPLGIYCRNCQAFSHKASSAVECHASLSITSLLSCITEHKITTSCQSVIFFFLSNSYLHHVRFHNLKRKDILSKWECQSSEWKGCA